MTKAAAWILTAALALLPTWVLAEEAKPAASKAVELSDAELDNVVAGAVTFLFLENPGNANVVHSSGNHFGSITGSPTETSATGVLFIILPSDKILVRCPGKGSC